MLLDDQVDALIREAHDSQVTRAACRVHALTQPSKTFPQTARAAALAECGAVGKAYMSVFSCGTESDTVVDATFLAKLTTTNPHAYVSLPSS
jgi:hypothetical protein